MTTGELIRLLKLADPEGLKPVVIYDAHDDYFFGIADMQQGPSGDVHIVVGDPDAREERDRDV